MSNAPRNGGSRRAKRVANASDLLICGKIGGRRTRRGGGHDWRGDVRILLFVVLREDIALDRQPADTGNPDFCATDD
jgi:hypothetical protein